MSDSTVADDDEFEQLLSRIFTPQEQRKWEALFVDAEQARELKRGSRRG